MRIVHLSTQHRALDVRIFHKECRTLAQAGYDTHLLIAEPPAEQVAGVRLHRLDKPQGRFRPARILHRLWGAYRQAAALKGDIYHFHDPELISVGWLLKRHGARVVYDVHEDAPQEAYSLNKDRPVNACLKSGAFSLLEGWARRFLDRFVCATPGIAQKFPDQRTITVQNYPRLEEFLPAQAVAEIPWDQRPQQVVYAGAITAIRGAHEMTAALGQVDPRLGARLTLLGEFHPPDLLSQVQKLAGWERVDYRGYQGRAAVRQALAESRIGLVLFHPERDHLEACPNKMYEYLAAGLPIIASDFPLWRRMIQEAECGLVVEPRDPGAIARAVEQLLRHPELARKMGENGRRLVTRSFNWETEARKLLSLYQELARS